MIANEGLDEVDLAFVSTLAPDDAFGVSLFALVSWIEPDSGESRFKLYVQTDDTVAQTIGLLELAKHEMVCGCAEDDDE